MGIHAEERSCCRGEGKGIQEYIGIRELYQEEGMRRWGRGVKRLGSCRSCRGCEGGGEGLEVREL